MKCESFECTVSALIGSLWHRCCRFNICSRLKINGVSQRFINHAGVTMDTTTFIRWWHHGGRDARKINATLGSVDSRRSKERLLPRVHTQRKSKTLYKALNTCSQRYNKQQNYILSAFQHHHCNKLIRIALALFMWVAAVWVWPQGWCNKILNVQSEIYGRKHKLTRSICCRAQAPVAFLCNMIAIEQQCAGLCGNVPEYEDDTRSSDGRQKYTCISGRISPRCAPGCQQEIASNKENISMIEVHMRGEAMTEIPNQSIPEHICTVTVKRQTELKEGEQKRKWSVPRPNLRNHGGGWKAIRRVTSRIHVTRLEAAELKVLMSGKEFPPFIVVLGNSVLTVCFHRRSWAHRHPICEILDPVRIPSELYAYFKRETWR